MNNLCFETEGKKIIGYRFDDKDYDKQRSVRLSNGLYYYINNLGQTAYLVEMEIYLSGQCHAQEFIRRSLSEIRDDILEKLLR